MKNLMWKTVRTLFTICALTAVLASGSVRAEDAVKDDGPTNKAVVEYLKLRTEGKRHWEALSIVRSKYSITDTQLEAAANRISTSGYPAEVKPNSSERAPGSAN